MLNLGVFGDALENELNFLGVEEGGELDAESD